MQLFTNSVFGNVRAVNIDGNVWFVGRDVVESLGYSVETKSYTFYISKFVKEKYTLKMNNSELDLFKMNNTDSVLLGMKDVGRKGETLINQYGVIQLVMNSKLPQAEEFQDWVIEEVIPSVLENGAYIDTSRADALPYIEQQLAEMEKVHEIDERYINSLRQRVSQAVKDRNDAWKVQSDRREIIDEMQRLINMLLEEKSLTKDEMKQLAKVEMLRELTGNMWVTK